MPGRSHRKGITTIELFQLFPDDAAAEKWFEEPEAGLPHATAKEVAAMPDTIITDDPARPDRPPRPTRGDSRSARRGRWPGMIEHIQNTIPAGVLLMRL